MFGAHGVLAGLQPSSMATKMAATLDIKFLLDPLLDVLFSVLVARIFLNIRKAWSQGLHTELHTNYNDSLAFAIRSQPVYDEDSLAGP